MINKKYTTFKREPFFELARKYILPISKVLDIGAGHGSFSEYFKRNDFYLFEGNQKSFEILKKSNSNVFSGELPQLPFGNNFFDVIHCSHVVEHLEPEIFFRTLCEIDRCLKTKGILVISAPLLWEGFYDDLSHVKPYNPQVFRNYLCDNYSAVRTRRVISSSYVQEKLVYRYREVKISESFSVSNSSRLINLFHRVLHILESRGLKKNEKTGFTLVLRKE